LQQWMIEKRYLYKLDQQRTNWFFGIIILLLTIEQYIVSEWRNSLSIISIYYLTNSNEKWNAKIHIYLYTYDFNIEILHFYELYLVNRITLKMNTIRSNLSLRINTIVNAFKLTYCSEQFHPIKYKKASLHHIHTFSKV